VVQMMSVSGGWSVHRRTSSLEMRSLQDIPSIFQSEMTWELRSWNSHSLDLLPLSLPPPLSPPRSEMTWELRSWNFRSQEYLLPGMFTPQNCHSLLCL